MAQQQILLVILVSIVISISTIMAIRFVIDEDVQLQEGDLTQQMLEIIDRAQAYWHKPGALGGGNHSFKGLHFDHIPCPLGVVKQGSSHNDSASICTDEEEKHQFIMIADNEHAMIFASFKIGDSRYRAEYKIFPDRFELAMPWGEQ